MNYLLASQHDTNTVYAVFNNHRNGDFKPYILKSTNAGSDWTSISSNLPKRGSVYSIAEDHVDPDLLFCGTEFGVFITLNGGKNWVQMKAGLPTIAIRDMEIQPEHNDLVLASFGRGFYVLDDYSPLRKISKELMEDQAYIFDIPDALMYREASPNIYGKNGFKGGTYWTADNPPFGASITYYLKDSLSTRKGARKKEEARLAKDGADTPYPSYEALRAEDREEGPYLFFDITDEGGTLVRRIKAGAHRGIHRISWDFTYMSLDPVDNEMGNPFYEADGSYVAVPGTYYVSMNLVDTNGVQTLVQPKAFSCVPLENVSLPAEDQAALLAFYDELRNMGRVVYGARHAREELADQWAQVRGMMQQSKAFTTENTRRMNDLMERLYQLKVDLDGDATLSSREFATPPGISDRLRTTAYYSWRVRSEPTRQQTDNVKYIREAMGPVLDELRAIDAELQNMYNAMGNGTVPQISGKIPSLSD